MKIRELTAGGLALVEKRLTTREREVPEALAALRAEAALLGALAGRSTPRLVRVGEDAEGPFFHMERVAFPTVAARLEAAAGPLDLAWVERATRAAFAALAALHEAADAAGALGAVHADPSPGNLAVDDAGARAVLLDLGLAVWRDAPPRDGAFRGTAAYVAPEVARGELPTARSDLFSLAATLAHAALGEPARRTSDASLGALIAMAAEEPVVDARVAALAARGRGHAALVACLAHAPEARPASAREVLAAIGG